MPSTSEEHEKEEGYEEDYYVVDAAHHEEATRVLVVMAKKKVRDFLYHAEKQAISHFYAETRGVRKNKDKVIGEDLSIKAVEFASIHPKWCDNKREGWDVLVVRWTEDEEFKAKSIQNKANHGKRGTHSQGNKDFTRFTEDLVTANGGQPVPEVLAWQKAHKKKEVVPGADPYYGTTSYDLEQYMIAFKKLHGEDSDPLSEPLDEVAALFLSLRTGAQPPELVGIIGSFQQSLWSCFSLAPRVAHCHSTTPRRS
ncbi:hypothetical protein ACQ4PT_066695 [Festuca glaucescens]